MKDIYLKDERNAKFAARHLSRNLYYEDDFSDSSLRVFLDNLFFPVVSVFFTITVVDNFKSSYCIQVNFDSKTLPSILIIAKSDWQFRVYWRDFRNVPIRYLVQGIINPKKSKQ